MKGQTFFPKQPKPNREEIARMARDLSLSAMALRGALERVGPEMTEDTREAIRRLCDYLDGNSRPDSDGDGLGMKAPPRWEIAHASRLIMKALARLSENRKEDHIEEEIHPLLTSGFLTLCVQAMWLHGAKGTRKTLETGWPGGNWGCERADGTAPAPVRRTIPTGLQETWERGEVMNLTLKTIRGPKRSRKEIAQDARDLSIQAMTLRSVMDELDKMQGRGEARIREDARRAVRHLADYLDGNSRPDPAGDEYGILAPPRWDRGHLAHLLRTATVLLNLDMADAEIDDLSHHRITTNVLDLTVRAIWLDSARGARKTLDRLARGELGL